MNATIVPSADRQREIEGWRAGRPLEDPEKMKRWGLVSAKPSEYLVHVRHGRITSQSGQGASCFKWPWDSVALVPTSLQEIRFRADQVTAEKVGVEVAGMAVYRIAEPLLAFRVLNFSYPERAQEKLDETLGAMLVGATRRIIASLSIDECMRKRKSALADQLLRDLAPVVGGSGRPDDETDKGWGVVIDAIEIERVSVLSQSVFAAMQAPFRAQLDQAAELSRLAAKHDVANRTAESERQLAEYRAECNHAIERARLHAEARLAAERWELERQGADAQLVARIEALDRAHREAEAELAVQETRLRAVEAEAAVARALAASEGERRRNEAELARFEGLAAASVDLERARAALRNAQAESQVLLAKQLPALAAAIGQRIGEVKIAHYGEGQPLAPMVGAIASLLDLVNDARAGSRLPDE
jgi:hypothetical protein